MTRDAQPDSMEEAFGFRVGDRVRHTSSTGNMGLGTVTSIADGDVVVQFDQRPGQLHAATGIYGEHWFRTANAKLTLQPRATPSKGTTND